MEEDEIELETEDGKLKLEGFINSFGDFEYSIYKNLDGGVITLGSTFTQDDIMLQAKSILVNYEDTLC